MLELRNEQLIRQWLTLRPDIAAGVFFDDSDQLAVLSQDGTVESLLSSPFSQQLHLCIVYLDDAHTRGTDLKLPSHFRAATTLGPKVTKDRLVQGKVSCESTPRIPLKVAIGCMRMRKLGHGQSVMFCAPPEVDRRIREVSGLHQSQPVKIIDVLRWAILETCEDILHHMPHWARQGMDHYARKRSESMYLTQEGDLNHLRSSWIQPEARALEELYGQDATTSTQHHDISDFPALSERLQLLSVAPATTNGADEEREHEREVEMVQEIEREQLVERLGGLQPATHFLIDDVRLLVQTGTMPANSQAFLPIMSTLRSTKTSVSMGAWSPQLWATQDFIVTTKEFRQHTPMLSEYQRPLNWILSFGHGGKGKGRRGKKQKIEFVALSPYEANFLIPLIRSTKFTRLHLYEPRVMESMSPIDNLSFYHVCAPSLRGTVWQPPPQNVRHQLALWSGQLYLDSYETYVQLCRILGLQPGPSAGPGRVLMPMNDDRFVRKEDRVGEMRKLCLFEESPVPLLKELFALRRKGMNFLPTHMGRILHGRVLSEEDFSDL